MVISEDKIIRTKEEYSRFSILKLFGRLDRLVSKYRKTIILDVFYIGFGTYLGKSQI